MAFVGIVAAAWLIPPDIPHAESIAMSAESHGDLRSYAVRRIKTANAVGSGKYVAGECCDSIRRLPVCRLVAPEVVIDGDGKRNPGLCDRG
jgi:hypothetical protein